MALIFETIVTTLRADGSVHIAPMGVREQDGLAVLAPFRPSATLDNLNRSGCAVLNISDDVRVFAGCLTGRRDWPTRPAVKIAGRVLEPVLAHRELQIERVEDDPLRPRFYCREAYAANHRAFRGFNRAQAAVIEAAILVSRLDRLPTEKIDREIEYLSIAIEKTAGPAEREAWCWLTQHIAAHRAARQAAPL